MNEPLAYVLIGAELQRLRRLPYSELIRLVGNPEVKRVLGSDGNRYQLEIEAVWDSKRGEDVRVIVAADDGGWRAFKPLTNSFIMRRDGSIVGESFGGY